MKIWKRNAVVATVLVLICAGVYLNWNANQKDPVDLTQTLNAEQLMGDTTLVMDTTDDNVQPVSAEKNSMSDSFAQIRLSRQESRDNAVELLQETIAFEDGSENAAAAATSLDNLVNDALAEARIESLLIAKGFEDCVAYMSEGSISIAVAAPEEGLAAEDVALISDIVTTQTDYSMSEIYVIEVK